MNNDTSCEQRPIEVGERECVLAALEADKDRVRSPLRRKAQVGGSRFNGTVTGTLHDRQTLAEDIARRIRHRHPPTQGGRVMPETDELLPDEIDRIWREGIRNLPPGCEHEWGGWREFDDGAGGEQFCQKCGYGAMAWSMRMLP